MMSMKADLKEIKRLGGIRESLLCLNRDELQTEFKKFFNEFEIACPHVQQVHRERSFKFIDEKLMANVLFVRLGLGKKMFANSYSRGGNLDERGIRCNLCGLVKAATKQNRAFQSPHVYGKGLDYNVEGMTSTEVRSWVKVYADLFPYKGRWEEKLRGYEISWVHQDVIDEPQNPYQYFFNV